MAKAASRVIKDEILKLFIICSVEVYESQSYSIYKYKAPHHWYAGKFRDLDADYRGQTVEARSSSFEMTKGDASLKQLHSYLGFLMIQSINDWPSVNAYCNDAVLSHGC